MFRFTHRIPHFSPKSTSPDGSQLREALEEAKYLLSNEYQSLIDEDLISEYNNVLEKITVALSELDKEN